MPRQKQRREMCRSRKSKSVAGLLCWGGGWKCALGLIVGLESQMTGSRTPQEVEGHYQWALSVVYIFTCG